MSLLTSRRLGPLLVTQALGAINDNLFKNAMVVLILFRAAHDSGPALVAIAGGVFILPYAVLSATAGQLADRFDKSRAILVVKAAEIALMALAALGFLLGSTPLLFAVLFGLGIQATLFGPLKYAILPSHLADQELIAGNGLMEAGTFLGILAGTIAGSALISLDGGALIVSATGMAIALAGVASAALIPAAPSLAPDLRIGWNVARETTRLIRDARAKRPVWLCLLGLSWFWAIGATVLTELPTLVRDDLAADPHVFTLMLACFSVGIGAGSVLCSRLLRGEVSARLVPWAALGLTVFLWDFGHAVGPARGLSDVAAMLSHPAGWRMLADLLLLAACGGLYSVPLYAIIQERAEKSRLARMVAANNVVNAAAMVGAAVVTAVLAMLAVAPTTILLIAAGANLLVAFWILRLLPGDSIRAVFRAYFRVFHGVEVSGLEHLPRPGQPAVIVVNHQSFADGAFVAAFLTGNPVFAVNVHIARRWWARPFLAAIRYFPIDPANPFSARAMVREVQEGQTLVIFPEGRITVTGGLMKVYEGAGMIAGHASAPLIPVRIDGLKLTKLSRMAGRGPRSWFPRLSLTVMPPVTLTPDAELHGRARRRAMGALLQNVMEEAAFATADIDRPLFAAWLDASALHGAATPIMEDIARAPLTYGRATMGAATLGRRLSREAAAGAVIGILLPNANAAVVTFLALQAFGRVPAMLNVSAGADGMLAACAAAQIDTVITSRAFVDRAKLAPVGARMAVTVRFVWLEDIRAGLGPGRSCAAGWTRNGRGFCRGPGSRPIRLPSCCSPAGQRGRPRAWCSATATFWPISRRSPPCWISTPLTASSTRCRCSTPSA